MINIPSDQYFAGFIDGEGCIRFHRTRKNCTGGTPKVSISNTYRPVLNLFRERFGGTVCLKQKATRKWRSCFEWYVTGDKARCCIRALLPYLLEKQEQARLVIQINDMHPIWRDEYIKKIKDLKKVDYK